MDIEELLRVAIIIKTYNRNKILELKHFEASLYILYSEYNEYHEYIELCEKSLIEKKDNFNIDSMLNKYLYDENIKYWLNGIYELNKKNIIHEIDIYNLIKISKKIVDYNNNVSINSRDIIYGLEILLQEKDYSDKIVKIGNRSVIHHTSYQTRPGNFDDVKAKINLLCKNYIIGNGCIIFIASICDYLK